MSDGGYGDGYDAGFSEGEKIWKAKALDLEVKRDIAVSTLEKVKVDRATAQKALAAQCEETKKLRAELEELRDVLVFSQDFIPYLEALNSNLQTQKENLLRVVKRTLSTPPATNEPQINLEGYREAGSSLAGENGLDSRLAGD
jgi:hypothetical protein